MVKTGKGVAKGLLASTLDSNTLKYHPTAATAIAIVAIAAIARATVQGRVKVTWGRRVGSDHFSIGGGLHPHPHPPIHTKCRKYLQ